MNKIYLVKKIEKLNIIILIVALLISIILKDINFVSGILAGGILGIINFRAIFHLGEKIFNLERGKKKLIFAIFLCLKFLILITIIFFIIKLIKVDVFGFFIGISSLISSIFIISMKHVRNSFFLNTLLILCSIFALRI